MIDVNAIENELRQVRQARLDAQAAGNEVEALVAAVQRFEPGKQRLVFMIEGGEEGLTAAN